MNKKTVLNTNIAVTISAKSQNIYTLLGQTINIFKIKQKVLQRHRSGMKTFVASMVLIETSMAALTFLVFVQHRGIVKSVELSPDAVIGDILQSVGAFPMEAFSMRVADEILNGSFPEVSLADAGVCAESTVEVFMTERRNDIKTVFELFDRLAVP